MSDRPILFSGPMVRALIAGTKTQTRRVLKKPKWAEPSCDFEIEADGPYIVVAATGCTAKVPTRYTVGDRLWVRETWTAQMTHGWTIADARSRIYQEKIFYKADGHKAIDGWWPSIHMPREFSRLTLTVTDVRIERLQDCSADDAVAEGVSSTEYWRPADMQDRPFEEKWWDDATFWDNYPQVAYRSLWEAINGQGSWEANPWVAAYTFAVERGNIDQLARAA